jgi:O-antigen/teichoic acid export membrane protein
VPFGLATVLSLLNRSLGNVVSAKYLGAAALAQLTIGTYGEPIILALRNSISTVVLPELVRRGGHSQDDALRLWHRTVVIDCMLLWPAAAIVAWYSEPLVVKAFGANYRPAIPVLQWYALTIVCACFDFSPLLRAINKTHPFITAGTIAALANGVTLIILLPSTGVVGAAIGLAVSNFTATFYLGLSVSRLYRCGLRRLLPWRALAKVGVCVAAAAALAFGVTFAWRGSVFGAACGSILYGAAFMALVLAARLEEATAVLRRFKPLAPALFRR